VADEADRHDVDEDVPVVRRVEERRPAHGRDADAVAVAADAADDAVDESVHPRRLRVAEEERVEDGDGARAHREDVAQDPADSRRGPLVGLDERRVVVRLHLEDDREALPDVDSPRVLARPLDDPLPGRRQVSQEHLRRLVGAVLAPEGREDAELDEVGLAPEGGEDPVVFLGRQLVLGQEPGGDRRGGGSHGPGVYPRPPPRRRGNLRAMFSKRTPAPGAQNRLTRALAAHRREVLDLTATNPTGAALPVDPAPALALLADARGGTYLPDPRGLPSAREAVSAYYAARGAGADPARLVLTASSSEAYSWLFKLLAEPGDVVLVPAPSYPLLDALAALEGVELVRYRLPEEDRWAVHADLVAEAAERAAASGRRVAAAVLVNPNNPTGTSISRDELGALSSLAARGGFALVSDEVFLDSRFADRSGDVRIAAAEPGEALVFSLGGLSKSAALPQLKLGWILANGPAPLLAEALERLAWIADSFLSVGYPRPGRAPRAPRLGRGGRRRAPLAPGREPRLARRRLRGSSRGDGRAALGRVVGPPAPPGRRAGGGARPAPPRGGGPLVHPGYFFDFPHEAFVVVSLLPPQATFREGAARLERAVSARR
jgi:alanine-synthesizing transaminase